MLVQLQATTNEGATVGELSSKEAWALAQLCKRITFSDCMSNATDKDEAYLMIDATTKVGKILAGVGIAPR